MLPIKECYAEDPTTASDMIDRVMLACMYSKSNMDRQVTEWYSLWVATFQLWL